jgi:hypothetical protein
MYLCLNLVNGDVHLVYFEVHCTAAALGTYRLVCLRKAEADCTSGNGTSTFTPTESAALLLPMDYIHLQTLYVRRQDGDTFMRVAESTTYVWLNRNRR